MNTPSNCSTALPAVENSCASPRAKWVPGPPKLLLLSILAMILAHLVTSFASLPWSGWRLLGLLPLSAGVTLNLLADRSFTAARTTVKPMLASTALVTRGVFRLTRNPMYLGFILLLTGLWFLLGSVAPGVVIVVFAILIDRYFVRPEEEKLSRTFAADYTVYCERVRRWL